MDVREKLVELLDDMQRSGTGYFGSAIENKKIADYLIRHGVTVQDWVSVDDRLPDVGNIVLIYSETYGVCLDSYSDDTFDYFDVTHWMPLPQPPKGE